MGSVSYFTIRGQGEEERWAIECFVSLGAMPRNEMSTPPPSTSVGPLTFLTCKLEGLLKSERRAREGTERPYRLLGRFVC